MRDRGRPGRYVGLYYLEPVTFIDHSTWMSLNSEVLQLQYGQGVRAGWTAIYFSPSGGGGLEPIPDALLASGAIFSDITCRIGE